MCARFASSRKRRKALQLGKRRGWYNQNNDILYKRRSAVTTLRILPQAGGRERQDCKICNRTRKRVSDAVNKLPPAAQTQWATMSADQKKKFRADNVNTLPNDLPTALERTLKETSADFSSSQFESTGRAWMSDVHRCTAVYLCLLVVSCGVPDRCRVHQPIGF